MFIVGASVKRQSKRRHICNGKRLRLAVSQILGQLYYGKRLAVTKYSASFITAQPLERLDTPKYFLPPSRRHTFAYRLGASRRQPSCRPPPPLTPRPMYPISWASLKKFCANISSSSFVFFPLSISCAERRRCENELTIIFNDIMLVCVVVGSSRIYFSSSSRFAHSPSAARPFRRS